MHDSAVELAFGFGEEPVEDVARVEEAEERLPADGVEGDEVVGVVDEGGFVEGDVVVVDLVLEIVGDAADLAVGRVLEGDHEFVGFEGFFWAC